MVEEGLGVDEGDVGTVRSSYAVDVAAVVAAIKVLMIKIELALV